jgi:GNAT superfamily N-acetyltransferase
MNNKLPSSGLLIRPATFTDIPFIRDIAYKTWPSAYEDLLGKQQVEYMLNRFYSVDSLEDQIKNQHYFFLALKNYVPIGFTSFSEVYHGVYKLQKLYVLPNEQKTGVGQELLGTIETIARSRGAAKLQLNVNRKNVAKSFYVRNGFTIIDKADIDIGNGYYMNDYIMEKQL